MASNELTEIADSIMSEPAYENESDIEDTSVFCEQVADWVSRLNVIALDEITPNRGSKSIVIESMEHDALQEMLYSGLNEDVDTDKVYAYLDAFHALKEMNVNLHEAFPRTFPLPVMEVARY